MRNYCQLLVLSFFLCFLAQHTTAQKNTSKSINKVVIKGLRTAYIPFRYFAAPNLQVQNNKLNISITDKTGDMLQINGIDLRLIKNGLLTSKQFKTVYISANNGTYTDDSDTSKSSSLEIKCTGNKAGDAITIGLKTWVIKDGKQLRFCATLSGIMPSYTYSDYNQN